MKLPDHFRKRVGMTTIGVTLWPLLWAFCQLGVDPLSKLCPGRVGRFFESFASYGVYYMVLSGLMLALDQLIARSCMGIATLVNMFLTGYIVDFSVWAIHSLFPAPGLLARIVFLAVGVLVMCFASSLYMTSNLGVSVYDAIPIVIAEKRRWPSGLCASTATWSAGPSAPFPGCCRGWAP